MPVIHIDALLEPVTEEDPCGVDLDGTQALFELQDAAKEPEERMFEGPASDERDWHGIRDQAQQLLSSQSKDLRVAVQLARALLHTDGLVGFASGIAVIQRLVEGFWEGLYPLLDPDDDNDPTERLNVLRALCDRPLLHALETTPLASARGLGQVSLREMRFAKGELKPLDGTSAPSVELVTAVFEQADPTDLGAKAGAAKRIVADLDALIAHVRQQVGAAVTFDLVELKQVTGGIAQTLDEQVAKQGGTVDQPIAPNGSKHGAAAAADAQLDGAAGAAPGPVAARLEEIRSREDVVRALDRICEYYDRYEPSSPVPLLMNRAKRLVSSSFMEIIRDLADKGLPQVETVAGKADKT